MILYYQLTFWASVLCTIFFLCRWKKNLDVSYAMMMMLITLSDMGAFFRSVSTTVEGAYFGNTLSYLGGCFLQVTITFCMIHLCRLKVPKWIRNGMLVTSFLMYGIIVIDPWTHWFYTSVNISNWQGITLLNKEYGPLHTLFYVMVIFYIVLNSGVMVYGARKKRDASVQNIILLLLIEWGTAMVYFVQKTAPEGVQLTALSYVIAQIVIIVIFNRIRLYDVDLNVMNALLNKGEMGCFSFTRRGRKYLGSNAIAEGWLPELAYLHVDRAIPSGSEEELFKKLVHWMDQIDADTNQDNQDFFYHRGDAIYKITGGYIYQRRKVKAYQFAVRDYTSEQKYIDLMNNYANDLEDQVEERTRQIREMHEKLVLGMADMVESRDPSTGGHIKRTSKVVGFLVGEMRRDKEFEVDPKFYKALIKAAPMHDLGKIAVDDVILRKPGKYETEEYEIMKTHAAKGADIVRKLLADTDDDYFALIAENVAHYHHERIDGTGYPCGLKGDEIPLEARIMAVADVYDALVSKRCYKEKISFADAEKIIIDGMGTQFDERLEKYFRAALPKLEAYFAREMRHDSEIA